MEVETELMMYPRISSRWRQDYFADKGGDRII